MARAFWELRGVAERVRNGKVNVRLDDFVASANDVELETLVRFDDLIDDHASL